MTRNNKTQEKEFTPGNVIYTRQNEFYDQIFSIHGDLVRKGAELDERNVGHYIDFLHSFISGYTGYIPEVDNIKKKIQDLRDELIKEEYLKRNFKILRRGILALTDQEFIEYKKTMSTIKVRVFEIFEQICNNLPKKNIFPKEVQDTNLEDSTYFS